MMTKLYIILYPGKGFFFRSLFGRYTSDVSVGLWGAVISCFTRKSAINYGLYPVEVRLVRRRRSRQTMVWRATERIKWPPRTPNDSFVNFGGGLLFCFTQCVCVEFLMFRIRRWLLRAGQCCDAEGWYLLRNFRTHNENTSAKCLLGRRTTHLDHRCEGYVYG